MVSLALANVARKVLEAVRAGAIKPGQPYTLTNLAHTIGVAPKSLKKLAEVWEILEQTGLRLATTDNQLPRGQRRYFLVFTPRTPSKEPGKNVEP